MSSLADTFVEFEIYLFPAKDFNRYMNDASGDENLDETERLIRGSLGKELELPPYIIGRVNFKPSEIDVFVESFSLMESHNNPASPALDSVEVTLKSGEQYLLNCTLQEFKNKISPYFLQKIKLPKAQSVSPK